MSRRVESSGATSEIARPRYAPCEESTSTGEGSAAASAWVRVAKNVQYRQSPLKRSPLARSRVVRVQGSSTMSSSSISTFWPTVSTSARLRPHPMLPGVSRAWRTSRRTPCLERTVRTAAASARPTYCGRSLPRARSVTDRVSAAARREPSTTRTRGLWP